jgi:MFS transporter, AAHS family, 3-hydroxyphenylpropionic acid transporter
MNQIHSKAATITLVCCVLVALCEGFDLQAAGVAAGGIGPEFHPTAQQMGAFFSASVFGLFLGALLGGRIADTLGRKRTLVVSVGLFGVFSLLTAQAWDIRALTAARFLTGLGLGGAFPTLVAWVNEHSTPERRRANVALVYGGMPFGGAIVSVISTMMSATHWRSMFVMGGIAPLILTPILYRTLDEATSESRAPASAADHEPKRGSFLAIFEQGRTWPTLLLWCSCFFGLLTVYLLLSWLPTLLQEAGLSKMQAGIAQIAFNLGGAISALMLGELLEGRLRLPSVITTFIAAPLLVFVLSQIPKEFAVMVLVVFTLGGALLAAQGYFYASAATTYPTAIRGVGTGATVAAGRLGSIAGPLLGGVLKSAGHGSGQLLADIVPLVILGSLAALAFTWHASVRLPAAQTANSKV